MFDNKMRYLVVNKRWLQDFHLTGQSVIGKSHYEIFPELPDHIKKAHLRGLAGEIVEENEDRFERQDGQVQWLKWIVIPRYSLNNEVCGIIIISEDVTDKKESKDALVVTNAQYQTLVEKMPAITYIASLNEEHTLIYISPQVEKFLGFTQEECITTAGLWSIICIRKIVRELLMKSITASPDSDR
jgi:PAS domain S-box-containing protein